MPRYPIVRAVDAPTPSARVLYDFNDDVPDARAEAHADGFTLGALSLAGDADAIGVEWSQQPMVIPQTIVASTKAAALARLQKMARALMRQRFWMMVQLAVDTTPVWWHAYRAAPGELDLNRVYTSLGSPTDRWTLTAAIDVDAFSYAARVTLPAQTVGNNPANDATAPSAGYNLPAIKGDGPARLRVKIAPSKTSTAYQSQEWMVACIASSRPAPVLRSSIGIGDGLSPVNGAAAGATDSLAVGGTSRSVAFSTLELLPRLVGDFPGPGALPGRYLVLLRCSASDGPQVTLRFRLSNSFTPNMAMTPIVSATLGQAGGPRAFRWVPLGVVGIGDGLPAGVPAPTRRSLWLEVGSSSTTATATLDDLMFVPIDGPGIQSATVLQTRVGTYPPGSDHPLCADGDAEVTWLDGIPDGQGVLANSGGFPTVDPAAAHNTLLALPLSDDFFAVNAVTGLAATSTVDVSYHPRSAWLGDGT